MTRARDIASSFRVRLLLGYVIVAAIFAVAWTWSLYGPLTNAVLANQERSLTAVAQAGSLLTSEPGQDHAELARRLVARTDLRVTIVAGDGRVIADSSARPQAMENHAGRPEIDAALAGRVGVDRRTSATRGDRELYVAVPTSVDGARAAFRVAQPLAVATDVASISQRLGIALLLVAVIVAGGVAWWASRAAAAPVEELSAAARSMADGDLGTRIPDVGGDLGILAEALGDLRHQMRARLDDLQGEQRTLRAALDGLADAVFLLDSRTIQFANESAGRLFRLPAEGWRGRSIDGVGLAASLVAEVERLAEAGGGAAEIGPDPMGRWLRVAVLPMELRGEAKRWLLVIGDVTERARVEHVRRDFVANASHELKTPVAGIQLLAESAETAALDGDTDQALAFSKQIGQESARLKRLVGDLLDLSRLELEPEPGSVTDMRAAIGNAIAGHRGAAERKGLGLDSDLESVRGEDVFAAANPTDVAIALDNLLDNAITYSDRGIVTARLSVSRDEVEIAVRDTGPGIPPADLPRIFERFYRVDRGRSRDSGGTGLGLSLVRHVVERSGGSVDVISTVGEGSTFTIRLPRAR